MYNALFGALDLEGKNFFYTNPLDANAQRTPWHVCPCCVGNIARTLLMLPTWMYSKGLDGIYVNLFAGSRVRFENVAGTDVEMVQATDYPWNGKIAITVNPAAPGSFGVRIRVPDRDVSSLYTASPAAGGLTRIAVNGTAVKPEMTNGYASISRAWTKGDRIELTLPMPVQRVRASDKIAAVKGKVALRVGPLLYNIEQVDQDITGALDPSAPLTTEWRGDLLGGVTVIKGRFANGAPMTAIPNFARYNRNPPGPPYVPPPPTPRPAPGTAAAPPPPRPAAPPATSLGR